MTKKEKIQEAWGSFWNPEIHHYSINGWSNPEHYSEEEMYEMMQEIDMEFGEFRCRPKSLQGIENNNGWIKIESEEDLPNIHCFYNACYFDSKKDVPMFYGLNLSTLKEYYKEELINFLS